MMENDITHFIVIDVKWRSAVAPPCRHRLLYKSRN